MFQSVPKKLFAHILNPILFIFLLTYNYCVQIPTRPFLFYFFVCLVSFQLKMVNIW